MSTLPHRPIGRSGLTTTPIILGSWLTYGATTDDSTAHACLDRAYELGINCFDTADVYNQGGAERVIGQWMKGIDRSTVILATKAFFPMSQHPHHRGLSLRHLMNAADASLERLQTDYIDLYQCHRYDHHTPLEETCFAMQQLIESGRIRYWGISQWSAVQIVNAMRVCEKHGWRKPISNQPIYNMLNRSLEVDVMQVCEDEGLGLIVYSPLAQGILSGKYKPGSIPADSRAANAYSAQWFAHKRLNDDTFALLDKLRPVANRLGVSLSVLALAWCLRMQPVTAVIIGASRVQQIDENLQAAHFAATPGLWDEVDQLLGNAPTDQYTGRRMGYGTEAEF